MKSRNLFAVALKSIAFAWRTNRRLFLVLVLLNILLGSLVYFQFTSFASIVNEIIAIKDGKADTHQLLRSSIILGLTFLVPTILQNLQSYYRAIFRLHQNVQLELFKIEKQGSLDIGTIESNSYQTLLRSAKEWGSGSVLNLQDFIFTSSGSFAGIITSMIILWALNPWLVLFAFLAAAPVYFFYKKYSLEVFRVRFFSIDDQRVISNRVAHFEELQKAVDVILLGLKEWLKNQVRDRKLAYNEKIANAERKKSISYSLLSFWYLFFLFGAISLMTMEALAGSIAVGSLLLAFNTYTRFYQTVNSYVESISYSEEAARYALRWFELFDLRPVIQSPPGAARLDLAYPPRIEFRNVSFRYPSEDGQGKLVLKNISFTVNPGEKLAIVGTNGSGKTTLIKLLARVYDPTEGMILINGIDLRMIRIEDWHQALGILFQDFPVYNTTIRESIGVGRIGDPIDERRMNDAAKYSGAEEFISDYDQLIWKEFKGGVDLSKGQHQRLAVARMFYRNALVTILDEPTASIDAVTEERIFTSLEKNTSGRTVVLITHRFSTVKNADTILLLENGELIEQGSHDNLMQLEGRYAALFSMQANRYLAPSEKTLPVADQEEPTYQ